MPLSRICPPASVKNAEVHFDVAGDAGAHTSLHRPHSRDVRDVLLQNFSMSSCPNGRLISGQDVRGKRSPGTYWMRNPKYTCVGLVPAKTCVVYSIGSFDEISFEVGLHEDPALAHCEVHVFDGGTWRALPDRASAARYNFTTHRLRIGATDSGTDRTLQTIMACLGHRYIDILKIDIEGAEAAVLPQVARSGLLDRIGQLLVEFHDVGDGMRSLLGMLTREAGFEMAYARREARYAQGTEVSLFHAMASSHRARVAMEGSAGGVAWGSNRRSRGLCAGWTADGSCGQGLSESEIVLAWPLPPGASWGTCGATQRGRVASCERGRGAWVASEHGIDSLQACAAHCRRRHACCNFVSYSALEDDCSWYTSCPHVLPPPAHLRGAFQSIAVRGARAKG